MEDESDSDEEVDNKIYDTFDCPKCDKSFFYQSSLDQHVAECDYVPSQYIKEYIPIVRDENKNEDPVIKRKRLENALVSDISNWKISE